MVGTSLVVQQLGLHASKARGARGSIPGQGTRSHMLQLKACMPQLKDSAWGLTWWRSGYESTCQCRGHGFEPWSGKIPHAAEQLSPCATTTEARTPRARAPQQEKPPQREASAPRRRAAPACRTRESPHAATKTPTQPKNIFLVKKKKILGLPWWRSG